MPLTVVLQQPRRLVVEAMAALVDKEPDATVVLAVTDPADLVARAPLPVDVAVLAADVDERDLVRTVRALRCEQRDLHVLGTVDRAASPIVRELADRHLVQLVPLADGVAPLLRALRGQPTPPAPTHPEPTPRPAPPVRLTTRELDVLGLLADGLSAQEASDHLCISRKTVENHKQRIFTKLDVQSQAHAVALAMRSGALDIATVRAAV